MTTDVPQFEGQFQNYKFVYYEGLKAKPTIWSKKKA